ncbi:MAG: YbjN domain-containing protein [Pseudanabaenaceae cyanobacterium SKYGB_i_bin29]|nr:YbjN domain-containing protein [Pseudanabaenaceae cyanobacterium SKYG29]MDW8421723.1 YbjN domain-containing protein [Pseudanabaenaceae cyanobacterium SKYGB_i_bin29]
MKFKTAVQQQTYEKIRPWLTENYVNVQTPPYEIPLFVVPMGSATAMVEVSPLGEDEALILVWAYVVTGADLRPDLLRFLLQKNYELQFGVFSIDEDGDIRVHASLIGSTCDKKELLTSLSAVLETADLYDDDIVKTWGGKRALDRMMEQ